MRLKAVLLGTTALSIIGAPVAVQAGGMDWAGFYAGVGIVRLVDGVVEVIGEPLQNATPITLETFAGYNHVMNQLLLGGEVAVSPANFEDVYNTPYHFQGIADFKVKLGYAGDGWSAYGLGGGSIGAFDYDGVVLPIGGFNFGAGGTVMVTDNLFVGVEFLQRNLMEISTGKKKAKKKGAEYTQTRTISGKIGFLFQ